ncbi:MAG: 2-isopropylmalate synthase [Gammaproteobacteria bacterium]|nr:2-isopropylmalate synthase [Gammaproteobacteria bacterium]
MAKVEFSNRTNLIEQAVYKYNLQDILEPNLFRELFPYKEIPKVTFNHRHVPMFVPDEVWITDTTFRDGQQSRSPYKVNQIVRIYDYLHELDNDSGLIRQTEFFIYSKGDRKALEKCLSRGYKYPEVTTWIRAKEEDFELVKKMEIKETGILVPCSDYHIFKKLNLTRRKAVELYISIIELALEHRIIPRCHFEDITRADFYGFVVPFANELMKLSRQVKIPIKIRACDTLGLGISYPGTALPRSVQGIIYGLRHYSEVPPEWIEWHGHNDFYKAVINSTTAWLYGASAVNTSLLGIGERTGNCPLEAMVIEYAQLRGTIKNMKLEVITEISNYFERELRYQIPSRTPFVGRSFNRTRAGIHADGILKDEEIYNIFDTEKLLKRPVLVVVGAHSGLAGIAAWLNKYFKLKEERKINKRDPRVLKLKEWVDGEYAKGRVTSFSDEELESVVKKHIPELFVELKNKKIYVNS